MDRIPVPEFLAKRLRSDVSLLASSCSFYCESNCEPAYETCGACEVCESTCQNSCQTTCEGACQDECELQGQVPSGAYIDFMSVSGTSIKVRLAGLDTTSQSNMGTSNTPRHNSYKISVIGDQRTLSKGSGGYSGSTTYNGLSPNTKYHFVATVSFTSNTGVTSNVTIEDYCTTLGYDPFDWTYAGLNPSTGNHVSGSTKLQGYGLYVTAVEWNELVGNVNEVCGTSIGTVKSGNAISATVVNQVATALGVTKVSRGSPIRASFFNSLRTAYNNLI